jgi:methyl-accepting chemotaxis protein
MKNRLPNLLGRLRLWQKLALLGWIAALLAAIPFYLFVAGQQKIIDTALQEQQGLEPAVKMIDLLRATAKHRGISASLLAGKETLEGERRQQKQRVDEAVAAFDAASKPLGYPGLAEPWRQFKQGWAEVSQGMEARSLSREQSWAAHTQLNARALELIQAIADDSKLSLDSSPDTYYLIQAILTNSAILSEKLGQARGFGASLLARAEAGRGLAKPREDKPITAQERAAVYSMADRADESFKDIQRQLGQFKQAATADMGARLEAPVQALAALVASTLPLAHSEVVEAAVLSYPSGDYFAAFTTAIDASFALTDAGSAALQAMLAGKIAEAQEALFTTAAFILLVSLLAAFFALFIARSITRPVNHLVGVMDRLAQGDSAVRARLETLDEIGVLGRQFDLMVDQREAVSEKIRHENEQLNNSVINLLQAVARLAEKDLTVKIPVSEDITGLVADALNLLAQEIAGAMNRVADIAGKVAQVSQQVKRQADAVIGVASEEKRTVEQSAAELSQAAEVMQDIAKLALSCNTEAANAIATTGKAQETVLGTIEGIATLRDTIRATEKRIKRLGERSQEIGGVVSLINSIAERTHILAINAAMHAASAGEAGRGFAVVASEVQKLAENAREATLKISSLVNNIQMETADTVSTMNDAISQVAHGTALAQQAGAEMRETRDTTASLARLVDSIAASSQAQAQTSRQLRERAMQIQKSTENTYQQLQAQGAQTEHLAGFSEDLVATVKVFILPKL